MILTGLLASTHGPSTEVASEILAEKLFANCVSLTDGRACKPTAFTSNAVPDADLNSGFDDLLYGLILCIYSVVILIV